MLKSCLASLVVGSLAALAAHAADHPDRVPQPGVPQGRITTGEFADSRVFPATRRKYAVYVPARYRDGAPANLMVFMDGSAYAKPDGAYRVPTVFDNLIHREALPVTIAVFVDPGVIPAPRPGGKDRRNRSFEYDSLGDRYVTFLVDELLPVALAGLDVSADPHRRAVCGMSSGGICAFTCAWERPDQFGRVLSHIGSFTNIRGGDVYPSLIRTTEPKPLRVYLADTSGDLDNTFGSWWLGNQQMAAALRASGYDLRFDSAEGYAHSPEFSGPRFPDAVQWLWRDDPHLPVSDTGRATHGDVTLRKLLVPGRSWEIVADDLGFADGLCADATGDVYFSDMRAPAVYRTAADDAARTAVVEEAVSGLEIGPGGLLYGCQGAKQRVISIDPRTGAVEVVATGITPNDLAITDDGLIFITETKARQVTRIRIGTGETTVVDASPTEANAPGIARPNGIALSRDGGTLAVSDHGGGFIWTFRVGTDGGLDAKMPTMPMRLPMVTKGDAAASLGDGMAVDRTGRTYVTSAVGVQVFDPEGRLCGVLPKPAPEQPLTSCVLGGPNHDWLYIAQGKRIYRRPLTLE
jgi:enterochelin esterase-like enzyme/sugar lactone lactonase YvrE